MKKIGYWLYGMLFHIFRILFPVQEKKVVLWMLHDCKFQGNIRYVYEEMKKRDPEYKFIKISKRALFQTEKKGIATVLKTMIGGLQLFIGVNYHLATSEYILLNDNFLPLAYMNPAKNVKIIQFWHGVGAFKRFGLSTETDEEVRKIVKEGNSRVTHLFVSSRQIIPYYEEAFGIEKSRIFATGIPVTDFYFDDKKKNCSSARFYKKYPELRAKKIVLYTPTFRETEEENNQILQKFDMQKLVDALGEEWVLLIRLHPQIRGNIPKLPKRCVDMTEYPDIKDLFIVSDVLINDYSSTVVEYVLLQKPIILYAYDLDAYDRGFYNSYRETAPGVLVRNMDEMLDAFSHLDVQTNKYQDFIKQQYDYLDQNATKRIVDIITKKKV